MFESPTDQIEAEAQAAWTKLGLIVAALVAIVATSYVGLRYLMEHRTKPVAPPVTAPAAPSVPESPVPREQGAVVPHRIEPVPAAPTVALDQSDDALLAEIRQLHGAQRGMQWLVSRQIVRHIVATVDALPRRQVPPQILPVRPVPGQLIVGRHSSGTVIATSNGQRYVPYVHVLTSMDPAAVASVYRRFYPLFQQAYRELGYPSGQFNDRLIEAIDDALSTPDLSEPLRVEAPGVMWKYADPDLEALSAGEKIMLRMGRSNAQAVRSWLRAFRKLVA